MTSLATLKNRLSSPIALALAVYCCGCLIAWVSGFRMVAHLDGMMHFMEAQYLRDSLAESLFYLHAQPPMLNLILGLALKLEAAGGPAFKTTLFVIHLILGGLAAAGFAMLAARMIRSRALTNAAIVIFALNPVFYSATFQFFYTIHEIVLLLFIPVFAGRFWSRRRVADFAIAGILIVAMVYTRSLFHPLWALLMLGGILMMAGRPWPRRTVPVLAGLIVAIAAWPVKNKILFGTFSYSSWAGYNISHNYLNSDPNLLPSVQGLYKARRQGDNWFEWTVEHADVDVSPRPHPLQISYYVGHPNVSAASPVRVQMRFDGKLLIDDRITTQGLQMRRVELQPHGTRRHIEIDVSPIWHDKAGCDMGIALRPWHWISPQGPLDATRFMPEKIVYGVPESRRSVGVLVDPVKPRGGINHNHYWMFSYSRRGLEATGRALMRDPNLFWKKIAANYLYFTRFSGRHPWDASYASDEKSLNYRLMQFYEILLCQDFRPRSALTDTGLTKYWPPSGFMITFPLIILLSIIKIARSWRMCSGIPASDGIQSRIAALMLFSILWVLAMAILVDGLEGNRIRFSTEPCVLILFFWLIPIPRRAPK